MRALFAHTQGAWTRRRPSATPWRRWAGRTDDPYGDPLDEEGWPSPGGSFPATKAHQEEVDRVLERDGGGWDFGPDVQDRPHRAPPRRPTGTLRESTPFAPLIEVAVARSPSATGASTPGPLSTGFWAASSAASREEGCGRPPRRTDMVGARVSPATRVAQAVYAELKAKAGLPSPLSPPAGDPGPGRTRPRCPTCASRTRRRGSWALGARWRSTRRTSRRRPSWSASPSSTPTPGWTASWSNFPSPHIRAERVLGGPPPPQGRGRLPPLERGPALERGAEGLFPCTPAGGGPPPLKHHGVDRKGKEVVVVGRSNIVGKPLAGPPP